MDLTAPPSSNPQHPALRWVRKVAVAVIGGTVVLIGAAMIVLPGPAVVVIPAGLAILATEFVWARKLLERARAKVGQTARRLRREDRSTPS